MSQRNETRESWRRCATAGNKMIHSLNKVIEKIYHEIIV